VLARLLLLPLLLLLLPPLRRGGSNMKGLEAVVAVTAAAIGAAVRPVSCCFDVSQYYTCTTLL
jgi:hypothetical protein